MNEAAKLFFLIITPLLICQPSFSISLLELKTALNDAYRLDISKLKASDYRLLPTDGVISKFVDNIEIRYSDENFIENINIVGIDNIRQLFGDLLAIHGFAEEGTYLNLDLKEESNINLIAKKLDLEFDWHIKRAKAIKLINPDEYLAKEIDSQVSSEKLRVLDICRHYFSNVPQVYLDKLIETKFMPFERGPRSLFSLKAKRLLSNEDLDSVHSDWDVICQEYGKARLMDKSIDREIDGLFNYRNDKFDLRIFALFNMRANRLLKPLIRSLSNAYISKIGDFAEPGVSLSLYNTRRQFETLINLKTN